MGDGAAVASGPNSGSSRHSITRYPSLITRFPVISLARHAQVLRAPDLAGMLGASVVARLPIGMASLALLLFVQQRTGSFAHAGTVSGLYVLGLALVAPALGRLIDRLGPRPVLLACAAAYPVLLLALIVLARADGPLPLLYAAALAAGAAFPPVTICVRTLLPRLVREPGLLHTAYSLDSVLIEFMFIFGPALVAAFTAWGMVGGAVVLCAVCAGSGAVGFARSQAVRRWRREPGETSRDLRGPLRSRALVAIYVATFLFSVAFGLFEVAVTAFATHAGSVAAAGVILALASVGSAAGAVYYGSHEWKSPAPRQFIVALVLMAASILIMAPLGNLYVFGFVSVLSGAPMATVMATQSVLISRLAPKAMVAESFTWGATSLLTGIGAGIAAGGVLVELWSPGAVFVAAAAATAFAAAVAAAGLRRN